MPKTDVQDPRRFDRFQGIDVRDDAEGNTLSDAVNVTVDVAGRLTRPKYPTRITDAGTESAPVTPSVKSAASMYDKNGVSVDASINTIEGGSLVDAHVAASVVTITGTNLKYAERVLLLGESDQCFMSGLDFTITATASSIVCTATSTTLIVGNYVVVWMPTTILSIAITAP